MSHIYPNLNTWKLRNAFLGNPHITREIKSEHASFLENHKNVNTSQWSWKLTRHSTQPLGGKNDSEGLCTRLRKLEQENTF